jgi:hypothetical protein
MHGAVVGSAIVSVVAAVPPPAAMSSDAFAAAVGAPGVTSVPFSTIQTNVSKQQPVFTFSVMGQPLPIPQYKVLPARAAVSVQNHWTGVGPFAR